MTRCGSRLLDAVPIIKKTSFRHHSQLQSAISMIASSYYASSYYDRRVRDLKSYIAPLSVSTLIGKQTTAHDLPVEDFLFDFTLFRLRFRKWVDDELKADIERVIVLSQARIRAFIAKCTLNGFLQGSTTGLLLRSAVQFIHEDFPETSGDLIYSEVVEYLDAGLAVQKPFRFTDKCDTLLPFAGDPRRLINIHPWWKSAIGHLLRTEAYKKQYDIHLMVEKRFTLPDPTD